MIDELNALLKDTNNNISLLANASSYIMHSINDLSWVGFYILNNDILELGPFQGKPACLKIPVGKGVCGKAIKECKTIIVPNVHLFPGHIACDSNTNSELVIPIYQNNNIYGVLDIDSKIINRFSDDDKNLFEKFSEIISNNLI